MMKTNQNPNSFKFLEDLQKNKFRIQVLPK